MAVSLENINFYRPPSLPVRPTKSTYPPDCQTPVPLNASNRVYPNSPTRANCLPTSAPQPTLHCPLPPRPPVSIPSSKPSWPVNTLLLSNNPVYPNDFDRAMQDLPEPGGACIKVEDQKGESREHSAELPGRETNDDGQSHATTPSSEISPSTATASSTSPTPTRESLTESTSTGLMRPRNCGDTEVEDRTRNVASTFRISPTPNPLTFETPVSKPVATNVNSTDLDTASLAQSPPPVQLERQTLKDPPMSVAQDSQHHDSRVENGLHNGCIVQQDDSLATRHSTTCESKESATVQSGQSIRASSSPPPIAVVIPAPSHRLITSSKRSLPTRNQSVRGTPMLEDGNYSDSVPSDDEDDADYVDEEQLPPSKRRRRSKYPSPPRRLTRLPAKTSQSEPARRISGLETESIPIQGFLRLRQSGSEITYCLEFSQTHFSSLFAARHKDKPSQSTQRTGNSTTRVRYSPEENALIVELGEKNLSWDVIEGKFAEQYPYRSKSVLQVQYSKLKRLSKRQV
ncbi:hypothetical protein BGW36DRAFT_422590 [Talaromyces proteolyticus]|uniref:Myb-like domain-containing protein n=1 Tax=Talaromyces proteolyticus TaxID=1131652 RepID=A0AAD4L3U5_9EURO|nr:uncharacterized protein BGW36DRAFT_422590 [Talaromyces proteolyticus]KAH8706071.1 hypothetical protein BGW36DRAFT_422590 [Talaromyces proteolyticus]